MLRQLGQIVLFKYADDAPLDRLYRHHRRAWWIVRTWLLSSVAGMALLAEFILTRATDNRILFACMIACWVIVAISMLPAILACAWAGEVEKELAARGAGAPPNSPVGERVGISAMKMCFWVAVLMVGVHFLG